MLIRYVLAFLLASLTGAFAADPLIVQRLPISDTNVLVLELPPQFQLKVVEDPEDGSRPAIRLSANGADDSFRVVFKIFPGRLISTNNSAKVDGPQSQAELDDAVKKLGAGYVAVSVEKTNEVHDLKLSQPGSLGAYSSFTDASLVGAMQVPPGEYRVITLSLVRVGDYLFTIQGGSNDTHGADYQAALKILAGMKVEPKTTEEMTPTK